MGAEPGQAVTDVPALSRRAMLRAARRQVSYLLALAAGVTVVSLLLSVGAAAVQARRMEARSADLVIVVAPAPPPPALVEHSFDLYRRGYASELALVGAGEPALRAALVERGAAAAALGEPLAADAETAQLRAAVARARAAGAVSVLIAGDGAEMLRWLKLAGDAGLEGYGAPTPEAMPGFPHLVEAGFRYWRYVLFQA